MDLGSLSIGQIAGFITTVGVISAFFYKLFSWSNQIKTNTKDISKINQRIDNFELNSEQQKSELLQKVENTNTAVNLLCSAISAMIDNELNDNKNKEQLSEIKRKLDEKKEIV